MDVPDSQHARTAILLPGTGSDEVFVAAAFARPLAEHGIRLIAPPPEPGADLAHAATRALDEAADEAGAPVLVGGISLGAHVAASWALRNQRRCAGLLAALPAWNGAADAAPAALAARSSASLVRANGLDRALDIATADVAPWLAAELSRAWRRTGPGLADGLDAAASHPAPELTALATLDVPAGIAACFDDDVHPADIAYAWADALPMAAVRETSLTAIGADPACLGHAAVRAYLDITG
ncbi:alpha/beta fold hydrolase [Haloechinothrix halophila]|uniref:thioesterase n=1 Tax=Haloechinothrix halophila TaxID=1069073 RepID=UPI00041E2591|nr:thioesterase [Haloechinothrix halophila]